MSRGFVDQLAVELAALVFEAGHDVYSDEVQRWLQRQGRGNEGQLAVAGRLAVERGLIIERSREGKRRIWGAPESNTEGAVA